MTMATDCTALVTKLDDGQSSLVETNIARPSPGPHQVLVRVSHVAQNPTDVQSLDGNVFGDGAVLGCDFVGSVEETGSNVTRIATGDVIAGLIWGGETKGLGGYSEYTLADEKICFRVPSSIPPAEASTIPLAALTALQALFAENLLNLNPYDTTAPVLIWGGSSNVGFFAIQILALYGFKQIITTCSPRNFDLVTSIGASHVFNYRDTNVVDAIRQAAPDLRHVFDTIGSGDSSITASQAINESGGVLCTVRPDKALTENIPQRIKVVAVLVWTSFLKSHSYNGVEFPKRESDHKRAAEFCDKLPELLRQGKFKAMDPKIIPGGLDSVKYGFRLHRNGSLSGQKIVYEL